MKIISSIKSHFWIIVILTAGVGYLLFLQWLTPDGVFFSGDSGLNAMLSQNLARGNFGFNLQFPDQPWVKALWDDGLFPYQEPFIYRLAGGYYITFPYTFPLVTAPFYAFWGYRGFYVIPCLATLAIWLVFYRVCKKMGLSAAPIAIGTAFLIFASYLTIYSAIYWEHTLSVCLAFAGLSLVLPPKGSKSISFGAAAWAGILSGLAVWFRPEQIFLVVFIDLLSLWALIKPRWSQRAIKLPDLGVIPDYIDRLGWVYPVTSSLTLLLYGLTNWLIYKNFFGVHAIQVIEYHSLYERFVATIGNLQLMTVGHYSLFAYVPIAFFLLAYLCFSWIKPAQVKFEREWTIWYIFCLAFVICVAVLVPVGAGGKQWGPRFLLLLVPVIGLLFTMQLDRLLQNWDNSNKMFKYAGWVLVLGLGMFGVFQNLFRSADFLSRVYAQTKPAVDVLRAEPEPVVAISDQYIGQVLQPALSRDVVFMRVTDENQLAKLSEALLESNQDDFTYICFSIECKLFSPNKKINRVGRYGKNYILKTTNSGQYGEYTIFNILVSRSE